MSSNCQACCARRFVRALEAAGYRRRGCDSNYDIVGGRPSQWVGCSTTWALERGSCKLLVHNAVKFTDSGAVSVVDRRSRAPSSSAFGSSTRDWGIDLDASRRVARAVRPGRSVDDEAAIRDSGWGSRLTDLCLQRHGSGSLKFACGRVRQHGTSRSAFQVPVTLVGSAGVRGFEAARRPECRRYGPRCRCSSSKTTSLNSKVIGRILVRGAGYECQFTENGSRGRLQAVEQRRRTAAS